MIFLSVLAFIVILGTLVLIHEIGHFVLARLFKVGIDEFGVGFPPRITSIKKGNTEYSLNWIPVGGFVKIKGVVGGDQMDSPVDKKPNVASGDDFASRPLWQRFSILFGGVFMNLLLAALLFSVGYMIGMPGASTVGLPENAVVTDASIVVVDFLDDAPAATEGLLVGDSITKIDGQVITEYQDIRDNIAKVDFVSDEAKVTATVERLGSPDPIKLDLSIFQVTDSDPPGLGVYLAESGTVQLPLHTALWYGTQQTYRITVAIFMALGGMVTDLFTGSGVSGEVSGPLGIASLTHEATQLGLIYLIQFAAILSINLAIFNLLPFPALDGGRILFLLIELVWRRPLNQKVEAIIHNVGFALLLLLILVITIKDVFSLF